MVVHSEFSEHNSHNKVNKAVTDDYKEHFDCIATAQQTKLFMQGCQKLYLD